MITHLKENEIFVFGSNLAGRHGKGAAATAKLLFGAKYGVGVGPTGQCYAIPTKDRNIQTLPLKQIEKHVKDFIEYAYAHPRHRFLVTPIGTGLAGYSAEEIAPMFIGSPENVVLPKSFLSCSAVTT